MTINEIPWWHTMTLPTGETTKGRNNPAEHIGKLGLPMSLAGMTVLDVGAWDGFYSIECAKRGARVHATDSYVWRHPKIGKHGFEYALAAQSPEVRERITSQEIDVLELAPEHLPNLCDRPDHWGSFDIVLCLGVLYHMRHPLLMLEKVFSVVAPGGLLVLETAIDALKETRPAAIFYPERELNNDPSNWWGPNPTAVVAMCKTVGFVDVTIAHQDARLVVHARVPA